MGMRKGIIILRPPSATLELRAQARSLLEGAGFECDSRERFDGAMAVSFEAAEGGPTFDEVKALLLGNTLLNEVNPEIKDLS